MQTPTRSTDLHSADPGPWHHRWDESPDTEQADQSGWGFVSVILVSVALWAGIILALRALVTVL